MSVLRTTHHDFSSPSSTPCSTSEEPNPDSSFDSKIPPFETVLQSVQTFDTPTLKIWEHFHSMPLHAETWDRFFDDQYSLESRLLAPHFPLLPSVPQSKTVYQSPPNGRYVCPIKDCPTRYTFLRETLISHFRNNHPDRLDVLNTLFPYKSKSKKMTQQ